MDPALRAGQVFDAAPQSAQMQHARRFPEVLAHFVAQSRKEKQFAAMAGFAGQLQQIRFDHVRPDGSFLRRERMDAETAQDGFEHAGEFAHGDGEPSKVVFEVVKDGACGVLDEVRIEIVAVFAGQFDRDHFGGDRDAFAVEHLEEQTIRAKGYHCFASSFLTSSTKSVASWNRRYTLAYRTYATSSISRRPSMTSLPMASPGTSRSYRFVISSMIFSTRSSMTFGLIGRF